MLIHRFIERTSLKKFPQHSFRPSSSAITRTPAPIVSKGKHHDLPTFLDHADSIALSPTSTVHVGTSYEYLCAETLLRLGFRDLMRTGGRSDRGIDLLGHWTLPFSSSTHKTVPVIVQCKATTRKPGPDMIRELEGAVAGSPEGWRHGTTVAVLCAKREATDGVRQAIKRSGRGIVWVMVQDLQDEKGAVMGEGSRGRVKQVLWNQHVGDFVGERVGAGLKYVMGKGAIVKEVYLTLDGRVWEPDMTVPNMSRYAS